MITKEQFNFGREAAIALLHKAGVGVTELELDGMDVADFGLNNYPAEGAQIITLLDTKKVNCKIICLMEGQVLPEHMHTASLGEEGKEETFRVIYGTLHLFLPGEAGSEIIQPHAVRYSDNSVKNSTGFVPIASAPGFRPPAGKERFYTCRRELILGPLGQTTVDHDTPHWFAGGEGGCALYTFSSWARDAYDPFTDPNVVRKTVVIG